MVEEISIPADVFREVINLTKKNTKPTKIEDLYQQALKHYEAEEFDEAQECLQQALELDPKNMEI
ncbi:unnamed protein product, partial [marine sediment metagenome]